MFLGLKRVALQHGRTMSLLLRKRMRCRWVMLLCSFSVSVFLIWTYSAASWGSSKKSNYRSLVSRLPFSFGLYRDTTCIPKAAFRTSSRQIIETSKIFPQLDFQKSFEQQPGWGFWNKTFEERYQQIKQTWKEQPLHVIIVPHSHADPGWLRTYDEYFNMQVSNTLDNMVSFLNKTPDFTFIWSEVSFFSTWWAELNTDVKKTVIKLLHNKQLEITTGGWVMTDEATAHYWSMVDQLIEGHQWLNWATGTTPSYSWSVDVFGHSATMPQLLTSLDFKGMVILRTHYAWKAFLARAQQLDFFWETPNGEILCHMAPSELYTFKHVCGPNHSICREFDFRRIAGEYSESLATSISMENVRPKVERLLSQYGRYASLFPHNVLLVPLGDDFRYDFKVEWDQQYQNYARLFSYINNHPELNAHIQFGTVSDYFDEVSKRLNNSFQLASVRGDFFPYADVYANGVPSYWTGFYSTRPFVKALSRELEHWLRASEILYSLARTVIQEFNREKYNSEYKYLVNARQNLALFQHHDAITGTAKRYVENDYSRRLYLALKETMGIAGHSAQYIMMESHKSNIPWTSQMYSDTVKSEVHGLTRKIILPVSAKGRKVVLFNSLTIRVRDIIKVRVRSPYVIVFNERGFEIQSQVNPVWNASVGMLTSVFEVIFIADIGPLSFSTYKLVRVAKEKWDYSAGADISLYIDDQNQLFQQPSHGAFGFKRQSFDDLPLVVDTSSVKASFSRDGLLRELYLHRERIVKKIEVGFFTYISKPYSSGAYLFQPLRPDPMPLQNSSHVFPLARIVRGPLMSEITFNQKPGIFLTTRLFHFEGAPNYVELESQYDISQLDPGTELVIRMSTNVDNGKVFYTDSNGLQILRRERTANLRVEGNYYPATSAIFIEDNSVRLNVMMTTSHGVTSPASGILEIMLDRKTEHDDNRGLGEGVMDNRPTITKFRLLLEKNENLTNKLTRAVYLSSLTLLYPVLIFIVENSSSSQLLTSSPVFASEEWPMHLVNFRTLPSSHEDYLDPSNSSLMILLQSDVLNCENREWTLRESLHVNTTSISETSLTGVNELKANSSSDEWRTFKSFNVTFK